MQWIINLKINLMKKKILKERVTYANSLFFFRLFPNSTFTEVTATAFTIHPLLGSSKLVSGRFNLYKLFYLLHYQFLFFFLFQKSFLFLMKPTDFSMFFSLLVGTLTLWPESLLNAPITILGGEEKGEKNYNFIYFLFFLSTDIFQHHY